MYSFELKDAFAGTLGKIDFRQEGGKTEILCFFLFERERGEREREKGREREGGREGVKEGDRQEWRERGRERERERERKRDVVMNYIGHVRLIWVWKEG